ncbi:MAG: GAF and ANTAR domain-containing protein [Nakamurella sp.]
MSTDERREDWVDSTDHVVGKSSSFAELVAELALSYADECGPDPRLPLVEQIVAGAVALLPGVAAAAVETSDRDGGLTAAVMLGDDVVRRLRDAQNRHREGPLLDALHDSKQVSVMDLSIDHRWPLFAAEAREAGVMAMICTSMEVSGRSLGVLTLLSSDVGFGDHAKDTEALARVVAAHAGLALAGARRVGDLSTALSSRDVIGQAKGILMERLGITPDAAFAVLVHASNRTNTKLRTLCETFCTTGVLVDVSDARCRRTP